MNVAAPIEKLTADLLAVEKAEAIGEARSVGAEAQRKRKPLVCKETEGQLKAETRNLERYKTLIWIVAVFDLVFIVATFIVLIQFTLGDAPKSSVSRVVYIIPIAGTLLGSGAVAFLMNERRLARKAVAELNTVFQRVCKDV